jgi:Flp pilus assembly protein TadD
VDPEVNDASAPPLEAPPTPVHAETLYAFFNFGWAGLRAREEDGWRLIAGPVDRLYRMTDDPGETHDVAARHPDVVARMRDALEAEWEERRSIAYAPESRDVTEAESEVLQSLGYVGGGVPADADAIEHAFERMEDPATRLEWIDRINLGLTLFRQGRVDEAVAVLSAVAREDPGNRFVLQHLGAAMLQAQRPAEARRALKDALSLGPNPDRVYMDLARAERALDNPEGEKAALLDALVAHPESAEVRLRLARPLMEEGELEAAATLIREALEIRPRSVAAHRHLAQIYQMQGKHDDARSHWERVIELDDGGMPTRQARRALQLLNQQGF